MHPSGAFSLALNLQLFRLNSRSKAHLQEVPMRSQGYRVFVFFAAVAASVFFGITLMLNAQQDPAAPAITARLIDPDATILTISKRVDEVSLLFTVTDSKGHFVTDLNASDLQVFDNRMPPESIRQFQKQSDLPLRVGLVIDLSESITSRFKFEKKAAAMFLKKSLRPTDQAFVVGFNDRVQLAHDFTNDSAALGASLQKMKAGGNTSLYDAIAFACHKLQEQPRDRLARKVLILITDGQDTSSKGILADAQQAAARADTAIFALSTNDLSHDEYPKGEAVLELLTRYAGGQILAARETAELSRAFAQVEDALRSQYSLAYKPANFTPDGSYRTIELRCAKPKLRVQCRRGYFAPRDTQQ
jgi:VWFA-related protein